jgi:hypothetical protein
VVPAGRHGLPLLALLPALVLGFVARPWLAPEQAVEGAEPRSSSANPSSSLSASPSAAVPRPAEVQDAPPTPASPAAIAVTVSALDAERGEQKDLATTGSGDFHGRLTAREVRPLEYTAVTAPACAFGGHAADLGPCMGPPTLAGDAIAGTHRVGGVDCCHHHQLAQRLGGDLEQLTATAELARQERVLPPLVAARIDRAVAPFLRARFGAWRAAGVDVARAEGHRARLDELGVATVDTWIELSGDPAPARLELRLVLEIADGADGDTLLELVTLTHPTSGPAR